MASASSMANTNWVYDVFLSFGEDTGDTFTGYLCSNLKTKGIITFTEEEETRHGKEMASGVLSAIKGSRIVIIILSRKYITSSRCLDELARIVECSESTGQTLIPVFYRIEPLEFQEWKGELGRAMVELEDRFKDNMEKVQEWRNALLRASSIFGWKFNCGYEWEIIERISQDISRRVVQAPLHVAEPPTGMDCLLNELKSLLCDGSLETCAIGLYGISRIAKTTIAKVCYNSLSGSFEGSSFLANISETSMRCNGLAQLQETLLVEILGNNDNLKVVSVARGINLIRERLRNKRVLIVLDDVDHLGQLEALAGSCDWFGLGSRLVITTRDEQLLVVQGAKRRYKIDELFDDDDALQHLGYAHHEICEMYRANFDALGHNEKSIFLDIACFFGQEKKDHLMKMLSNCNFYPDIGIPILAGKSLIDIKGNKLQIYDLLQQMGRDIVWQESPNPENRSRLWFHEDVLQVLEKNSGTDAIEGILVDLPSTSENVLNALAFANMRRLRLLIVKNACFSGGLEYLPNELRWLEWSNYPSASLPSDFRAKKLTVLKLHSALISQLWHGFQMLNLAIVELIECESLCEIPNVSAVPNLESLIVNNCTSLVSVHKSVGFLQKLTVLNFQGCSNLRKFPRKLGLVSLKTLILSGCLTLEKFPDILPCMERVESIDLSDTALKEMPSSIENLIGLKYLKLNSCRNLKALPNNIYSLKKIKSLHLKGCTKLQEFPADTTFVAYSETGFPMLESLDASSCSIANLDFLEALNCLTELANLDLSRDNLVTLPPCICKFSKLKFLHLEDCKQLREVPELPANLTYLNAKGCESLERLHTRSLQSNTKFKLDFSNCHKLSQTHVAKKLLNEASFRDHEFQVMIPGSDIPDKLSYRSPNCSMTIEVKSSVCEKLVGLIVATAFCLKDKVPVILKCNISVNGKTVVSLASDLFDSLEGDHLWLGYFPLNGSLEGIRDGWNQVEISFGFLERDSEESKMLNLNGSGFRFLGKTDEEEVNGSAGIRVLYPQSCRFLGERAAKTSFDPVEDFRFTKTEGPDVREFYIQEVDRILPLSTCQETRNAAIPKQNCGFGENSISMSCNLLPEKGEKKLSCTRQRKWWIGMGPKSIPFKITLRRKGMRRRQDIGRSLSR